MDGMPVADSDLLAQVRAEVSSLLDLSVDYSDQEIRDIITEAVIAKTREHYLSLTAKKGLVNTVFNAMRRLDIIQPLLDDPAVTEIMINSPDEIFIEKEGRVFPVDIRFSSSEKLENIIQSVVARVNRAVNEACPIVDARLPDGSRVNVVLPPVALKGPTMTIRKFPQEPLTMKTLVELGSLSGEAAFFLQTMVQAKYNIFISGGTGSGKTTFLNALSGFIAAGERIITIEDSAELQLAGASNLVRLETRNPNTEGKGEVTIRELIKTSLRMRPDRIVVGEVRGPEALDMLQAMNTGHDGSLSTGHANSSRDMLTRLETMIVGAALLPVEVVRKQMAAALEIIVHLARLRDGSRRVMEISEITGCADGDIITAPLFMFIEEGEEDGRVVGALKATGRSLTRVLKIKAAGFGEEILARGGVQIEG